MSNQFRESQHWQRNITALEAKYPELARDIRNFTIPEGNLQIGKAGDGSPILGLKLNNGQYAALGDNQAPQIEADTWVKNLGKDVLCNAHVLLLGIASGYSAVSFYRQSDSETYFWLVEPDPGIFKAALHIIDLTEIISSHRVHLVVGKAAKEVAESLYSHIGTYRMRAQGLRMAVHPISKFLYGKYVQSLTNEIQESIRKEKVIFHTSEVQAKNSLNNICNNLPNILRGSSFHKLQHQAVGVPALVIAPGPSLMDALPYIEELSQHALIVTVDTAYRILNKHKIKSDFVVSLDFTELNTKHFDLEEPNAHLIAFPSIHPDITGKFIARSFYHDHVSTLDVKLKNPSGATKLLRSLHKLGPFPEIVSIGSTAHSAYSAARFMGCNPIILVGNDLCFADDKQYADGAMQNEVDDIKGSDDRYTVEANSGPPVITNPLYKIYLEHFEKIIKETAGEVINTSTRGAKIKGTRYIELQDVILKIKGKRIDKSFIKHAAGNTLFHQTENVCIELDNLAKQCRDAQPIFGKHIRQLEQLNTNNKQYRNKMIALFKEFVDYMNTITELIYLCNPICSRSTVVFFGQMGDAKLFGGNTPDENKVAKERALNFYHDFQDALGYIADEFEKAKANIEAKNLR